jgi:hypothetical protein
VAPETDHHFALEVERPGGDEPGTDAGWSRDASIEEDPGDLPRSTQPVSPRDVAGRQVPIDATEHRCRQLRLERVTTDGELQIELPH